MGFYTKPSINMEVWDIRSRLLLLISSVTRLEVDMEEILMRMSGRLYPSTSYQTMMNVARCTNQWMNHRCRDYMRNIHKWRSSRDFLTRNVISTQKHKDLSVCHIISVVKMVQSSQMGLV